MFIILFIFACTSSKQQNLDTSDVVLETDTPISLEESGASEDSSNIDTGETENTDEIELEPFEFSLSVVENFSGGLQLTTNIPMNFQDCERLRALNLNCADNDQDGLTDEWEDVVIEYFRPILSLDEGEPFPNDPNAVFAQIARITPTNEWIDLFVVLGWSEDYGRCGISAHHGDSERVALRLVPDLETNSISFYEVYTAAHEGEITDAGRVWSESELNQLDFILDPQNNLPRWVVYPSEGKHATFASIEHCESISWVPCLDEDCAPDGVSDPSEWFLLGQFVNAGEDDFPIQDDLSIIGFPAESAWGQQDFCGGLGGSVCSSPIREKLLHNPF